jgi:hypothetical protein
VVIAWTVNIPCPFRKGRAFKEAGINNKAGKGDTVSRDMKTAEEAVLLEV